MAIVFSIKHEIFRNIVEIKSILIVGSSRSCDICIDSNFLSRYHGEFSLSDDKVYYRDMGSKNGSLINLGPIAKNVKHRIYLNDVCYLGDVSISIQTSSLTSIEMGYLKK